MYVGTYIYRDKTAYIVLYIHVYMYRFTYQKDVTVVMGMYVVCGNMYVQKDGILDASNIYSDSEECELTKL